MVVSSTGDPRETLSMLLAASRLVMAACGPGEVERACIAAHELDYVTRLARERGQS